MFLEKRKQRERRRSLRRCGRVEKGREERRRKKKQNLKKLSSTMTRGGGLLEAAAAASRLLRRRDGPARRLLSLRRALTADAAESVHQEEQQQQQQSPSSNAADADDDEFDSAHARRLREMEASTSMRGDVQIETASHVSSRLRSEQRSTGKASTIRSSFASPSSPDNSKSDRSVQPAVRDWRDALEAAKMLEPGGDPLTDSFG